MRAAIDAQRGLFARTAQRRIYPSPSSGVAESAHAPRSGICSLASQPALERARIQPSSAVFGLFAVLVSLVFTRCSEDSAHNRLSADVGVFVT